MRALDNAAPLGQRRRRSPGARAEFHRQAAAIIKQTSDKSRDPHVTALEALGWVLADQQRAQRFLDLTGLSPDDLRQSAGSMRVHRAVLDFLCAHEPDLVAASESLGMLPEELAAARTMLDR